MFMTQSQQQSRLRREALDTWRAAACLVVTRWDRFLHAEPDMGVFAFASHVAALGCEEAAAADLEAIALPAAA
jgi:tRNA(Leu) C34 or U34 (ribose-2'-O)-methylase TrmL